MCYELTIHFNGGFITFHNNKDNVMFDSPQNNENRAYGHTSHDFQRLCDRGKYPFFGISRTVVHKNHHFKVLGDT